MSVVRAETLELALTGQLDASSDTLKLVLVDDTYTYNAAHDRLNDVTSGARIVTLTLTGKDTTDGVLTAADPANPTPTTGKRLIGAWLYRDTGVSSTSELLVWLTIAGDGFFLTDGDPIRIFLPTGPYGLLKL